MMSANTKVQSYSSRSVAVRGARRAGLKEGTFTVEQGADGRWVVLVNPAPVAFVKGTNKVPGEGKKQPKTTIPMLRKSEIEDPCKTVWHIADSMKDAKRRDVIAACVAQGIAFYTARTQYQMWKTLQLGKVLK